MYESLSSLLPKSTVAKIGKQLRYNSIQVPAEKFAGMLVFYSLLLAIVATVADYFTLGFNPLIVFALALVAPTSLLYIILSLQSDAKGKFVEGVLPDVLQLIASNMKSGLTTERAIFVAARPEFGRMQIELLNASKHISTGENVETALKKVSDNISSVVLEKTVWLISQGIRSGAQMADLLFQLSDDIKNEEGIKDEIKANISIYILLILFASAAGAPVLFGVSTFIAQVVSKQVSANNELDVSSSATQGAGGGSSFISTFATGERHTLPNDFIIGFALMMLCISSFFSSLTIGVINAGKELNGVTYIIPILLVSIALFFATRTLLLTMFGSLV